MDDTLLYDNSIEESFSRACQFLDTCAQNGIVLNQFSEKSVEFLGFTVGDEGVRPTDSFVDSILNFPTPTRSWYGAVAQVSYSFATSPVMLPFKHLLSSKTSFSWSPELEEAFKASKQEVVDQCMLGVRTFDPNLPTALSTDWCKTGMGFWLCQKKCKCVELKPGCCPKGWQTVIDRSFNDTLAKCLFSFSSISQEKYTVQQETIISVLSISITVHFCTYSYESLFAKSIF